MFGSSIFPYYEVTFLRSDYLKMKNLKELWKNLKVGDNIDLYVIFVLSVLTLILSIWGTSSQQPIQALFLSILALLAISLFKNRQQSEEIKRLIKERSNPLSERFFRQEDDINEITQAVRSSQKSYFWGTALVMHIPMLKEELGNTFDNGKEIRFLLVKPYSSALSMAAFRAREYYRSKLNKDLLHNLDTLNAIASRSSIKGKLEVKVIDYFSPYTLYIFDVDRPTGWAQARLYSLRVAYTNRPTYRLTKRDDSLWYDYHVEQFEKAWESAESYRPLESIKEKNQNS
jgi:hypothetical protein